MGCWQVTGSSRPKCFWHFEFFSWGVFLRQIYLLFFSPCLLRVLRTWSDELWTFLKRFSENFWILDFEKHVYVRTTNWITAIARSRSFPSPSRLPSASNLGVNPSSFWAFLLSKEFSSKSSWAQILLKDVLWLWIEPVLRCVRWASFTAEDKDSNPLQPWFFSVFTFNLSSLYWEITFPYLWKHPSCVPHRRNPKFVSLNQRMMFHHQQNTLFLWYYLPKFDLTPGQKNFLSLMRRNIKWRQTATERRAAIRFNLWCLREYFGLRTKTVA